MKIIIFRGDLTDISAKKEALLLGHLLMSANQSLQFQPLWYKFIDTQATIAVT